MFKRETIQKKIGEMIVDLDQLKTEVAQNLVGITAAAPISMEHWGQAGLTYLRFMNLRVKMEKLKEEIK